MHLPCCLLEAPLHGQRKVSVSPKTYYVVIPLWIHTLKSVLIRSVPWLHEDVYRGVVFDYRGRPSEIAFVINYEGLISQFWKQNLPPSGSEKRKQKTHFEKLILKPYTDAIDESLNLVLGRYSVLRGGVMKHYECEHIAGSPQRNALITKYTEFTVGPLKPPYTNRDQIVVASIKLRKKHTPPEGEFPANNNRLEPRKQLSNIYS
ncbi:hypothetical protein T265_09855 [Opisthorchis viverrini]|uniref:Uncharacterized protein n=1 Tax=Opisthorchis viverrini TaxID=6198 RepID=A0A074Z8M6_OPIVI|nr:hypothetical protein T265_09855 [Opisthorchis viverrini]KER21937.1 hypothetical protein T265_09855 [Opisthorchis viverrini]